MESGQPFFPDHNSVMIVENDMIMAMLIKLTLQRVGCRVLACFKQGEDALLAMKRGMRPDVLMLDIHLDGIMDGFEMAHRLRQFSNTPVIFMTGLLQEEIETQVGSIPSAQLVAKPLDESQLLFSLRQAAQIRT